MWPRLEAGEQPTCWGWPNPPKAPSAPKGRAGVDELGSDGIISAGRTGGAGWYPPYPYAAAWACAAMMQRWVKALWARAMQQELTVMCTALPRQHAEGVTEGTENP